MIASAFSGAERAIPTSTRGGPGAWKNAWATWPKQRLAGIVADDAGEFYTFPLVPIGRKLQLNARIERGGEIRVGLVGPGDVNERMYETAEMPGRTVDDCAPVFGDSLAHDIHWKGETDIGIKDGQTVCLRLWMRSATLFAATWVS